MTRRYLIIPLSFFLILLLIKPVYADDDEPDINLLNLPTQLASHWGISTFAAGLFLSGLLIFPFMLALAMLGSRKITGLILLITSFIFMGFCISIGWLPYWIMLLLSLLIAAIYYDKIKQMI